MVFDRGRNHIWVARSVSWLARCPITLMSTTNVRLISEPP
jgi:hypothetical protein